jgi:DNA-binding transcriptional ArsR family regulator
VTPSAVSQHLAKLRGAGVVNASREGREVLYVLSPAGEALLGSARPPRG